MFERILLAVDGSDHSKKATAAAGEVARGLNADVFVIHVHELGVAAPVETPAEAEDLVEGVVQELHQAGVKAEGQATTARSGQAAPAILDAAKALNAGLIVMGTRGLSDFSGLL